MADLWYFTCEGKQMEPVTSAELTQLAGSGFLRADDLVWKEGMANWTKAGETPQLSSAFAGAGSSTPTAAPRSDAPVRTRTRDDDDDRPRRRRRRESEDDDRDSGRPRRGAEPAKGMSGRTIGLIIGAVALAVAAVIVLAIVLAVRSRGTLISSYSVELPANSNSFREFHFEVGILYDFRVISDSETDVDLIIEDANGVPIDGDDSEGRNSHLIWSPAVAGKYRVKLSNLDFAIRNRSQVTISNIGTTPVPRGNGPPMVAQRPFPAVFQKDFGPAGANPFLKQDVVGPVQSKVDWDHTVAFRLSKKVEVTIVADNPANLVDLFIIDPKGKQVAAAVGPNGRLSFTALSNRSYVFRIRNRGNQPVNCTISYTRP